MSIQCNDQFQRVEGYLTIVWIIVCQDPGIQSIRRNLKFYLLFRLFYNFHLVSRFVVHSCSCGFRPLFYIEGILQCFLYSVGLFPHFFPVTSSLSPLPIIRDVYIPCTPIFSLYTTITTLFLIDRKTYNWVHLSRHIFLPEEWEVYVTISFIPPMTLPMVHIKISFGNRIHDKNSGNQLY